MAAVVIAAASPLIALARVDGLAWLRSLFREVWVPEVLLAEVLTGHFPVRSAAWQRFPHRAAGD
jgi:hypothetical protein